jgi:hypothetical protein
MQPDNVHNRKRHMQGRAGITGSIYRLQKVDSRILRPIYIGSGDGRGPEKENPETYEAEERDRAEIRDPLTAGIKQQGDYGQV